METLDRHLGHGPLPLPEALRYGIDVAENLRDMHARGRVFAFLQPANVAIVKGRASLGPPKAVDVSPYFSPEQVRGKDPDSRSDLFSLGAILYEMLTGRRAFPAANKAALRGEILEWDPAPLKNSPPALAQLISHCLEKCPEQRLQRVAVLLAGLKLQYALVCTTRPELGAAVNAPERAASEHAAAEPGPAECKPGPAPLPPTATETFIGQVSMAQPPIANPAAGVRGGRAPRPCPRCSSSDVRCSRPKDWFERALVRSGAGVYRCHRCFYRFLYGFGISIGRQGMADG